MKTCTKCKIEKSLSEFPTQSKQKGTKEGKCKTCKAAYKRSWYDKNKDYLNQRPNTRWNKSKFAATERNLEWRIPQDEYEVLLKANCYYCDGPLSNFGSSLDRLDNDKGYLLDNVVPCCAACNVGRNQYFTPDEWKVGIQAILEYRCGK